MWYHCNLICVSPKHGMHGSLRCLEILYIHNCWNLFFLSPNRCETKNNKKLWNFKLHFVYRSVISSFAVLYKYFYYRLVLTAKHTISVLATPDTSANLRNQAPLFTELCLLQGWGHHRNLLLRESPFHVVNCLKSFDFILFFVHTLKLLRGPFVTFAHNFCIILKNIWLVSELIYLWCPRVVHQLFNKTRQK